jgi:predicted outer membrane protein
MLAYTGKHELDWIIMLKEHDGPNEPAEKRAERKWKNNQLRQKIIASKVKAPVVVDPNAPPEVATVIVNKAKRRPGGFERKFLKYIREMMEGHKERNVMIQRYLIYQEKRKILLELIRRREVRIAEREGERSG